MRDSRVRPASANDFGTITSLLIDADLPVEDLAEHKLALFYLAEHNGECIGAIGMERHGHYGLLRSLVVSPAARRGGLGKKLVDTLERNAADVGLTELWLLTIDAEDFFCKLKYKIVSRDLVPDAIRQTKEFSDLCPGTAHLMMKSVAN